jgi:hypothetical protein
MHNLMTHRPPALAILGLAIAAIGCALPGAVTISTPAAPTSAPTLEAPTVTAASPTAEPATPTPEPSTTPTPSASADVHVTATGGNLTLRRGPASAYNVLNYMLAGQTALAVGRNQAADWLLVQDPAGGGKTAWITAASRYSVVDGGAQAVQALPIETVDPAVPAYIRNCTFHPMRIMPVDVILKEMFDVPNNMRAFHPGQYEAYDQNQEGYPKVMSEELREGETIDIEKDGLNNTYLCPA